MHRLSALPFLISSTLVVVISLIKMAGAVAQQNEPVAETTTPTSTPTTTPLLLPTETDTPIPTSTWTETLAPTATSTISPTSTATPTLSPSHTPTLSPFNFLPSIYKPAHTPSPTPTPSPPETRLFCNWPGIAIPDDELSGVSDYIYVSDARQIVQISLYIDIRHSWVGDLTVRLRSPGSEDVVTVIERPGGTGDELGCGNNDLIAILDDRASYDAEDKCAVSPAAISGTYRPNQPLGVFYGENAKGTWVLNVSDNYRADLGYLRGWCLEFSLAESLPLPTPTPTPFSLPNEAFIPGMSGEDQSLPLDCESRSAVDWAAHWGYSIGELEFFYGLPESDDPDSGFVGNVYGEWGHIPPEDYGVHAQPIAARLNDYGLAAYAIKSLSWEALQAEIAAGRPVIVWIIGGANHEIRNGVPIYYTASSNGHTSVVAAYEHTVIVIGYSPTSVVILNGSQVKTFPIEAFLDSWSALRFMAVLARP